MLKFSFLITNSGLKKCSTPKPSQLLQAPAGLLNEKVLGSSSVIENPHEGHANLLENNKLFWLPSRKEIFAMPLDNSRAVSKDSVSLNPISVLTLNLSTTTSIVFFFLASITGKASIS